MNTATQAPLANMANKKPKTAPKRDLATELFGAQDAGYITPVFIDTRKPFPPYTRPFPPKQTTAASQATSTKSMKQCKQPRQLTTGRKWFWSIAFLISLALALPSLLPMVKNVGNQAVQWVNEVLDFDDESFSHDSTVSGYPSSTIIETHAVTVTATEIEGEKSSKHLFW